MTFFVTEDGTGAAGGDLGGLSGADGICDAAAVAAGITGRTWRAYLSADNDATFGRIDARDRIGAGPWFNHGGLDIGDLNAIHTGNGIDRDHIRSECGMRIVDGSEGGSLFVRAHDIMTGSNRNGELVYHFIGGSRAPFSCDDWTSSSPSDWHLVGHSNHLASNPSEHWNNSHNAPCDQAGIESRWGIGRIYCFAIP